MVSEPRHHAVDGDLGILKTVAVGSSSIGVATGRSSMKQRIAVLDDYQNVALDSADWSTLSGRANSTVFDDPIDDTDALVERLSPNAFSVSDPITPVTAAPFASLFFGYPSGEEMAATNWVERSNSPFSALSQMQVALLARDGILNNRLNRMAREPIALLGPRLGTIRVAIGRISLYSASGGTRPKPRR